MLLTKLKGMTAAVMVGCAVLVTAAAGWQAEAAPQDRPAGKAADAPRKSDKDRIAELERERERLLQLVADLQDRLMAVEQDRKKEKARGEGAGEGKMSPRGGAEAWRVWGHADLPAPAQPGPASARPAGAAPMTTAPVDPRPGDAVPSTRNATAPVPAGGA